MTNRSILTAWAAAACLSATTLIGGCTRHEPKAQAATASPASHKVASKAVAATTQPQDGDADAAYSSSALGVEAFMRSADPATKSVAVKGVVSGVAKHKQMLGLIDCHEAQECNSLTCAELTLPVKWTGKMPTVGETVQVTGHVTKQAGGKVFLAQAMVPMDSKTR